jgi:YjbE family integral membrane protein
MEFGSPAFWVGLLQIIGIDIVLSGDNALVIALACRSLPPEQRKWGVLMGTGAAIVLRIAFAAAIVYVLEVPFLKFAGAVLLVWIAAKLVMPSSGEGGSHAGTQEATSLWQAVKIVAIADAVMSLDNVLSVAAAAKGSVMLLTLGIAISIPLMVVGSAMMLWLLDRVPLLAVAGAGLLGWIAGELAVHDPIAGPWIATHIQWLPAVLPAALCIGVMAFGLLLRWKAARQPESGQAAGDDVVHRPSRQAAEELT